MSFQPPIANPLGPGKQARTLTQQEKAAVVILLLITGGVDPGVKDLPAKQQRQLVRDMAKLRFIDRDTLADVVREFASELDSIGLHFPSDQGRILALLDKQLSLEVVEAITAELGESALPDASLWDKIAGQEPEALLTLVEKESDEIGAILMSKLPPDRAAKVMGLLPQDRADAIAAAFARTEGVSPNAVAQIGMALGRETANRSVAAFETDGVKRVGDILNRATSLVRRTILEKLEETNPEFANRVKVMVFSFENIPERIEPRDLPKVLRVVDNSVLVTALASLTAAQADIEEFILGSISKRMADQIREEMAERGPPSANEGEEATAAIVAAIRQMEEDGELTLNTPAD